MYGQHQLFYSIAISLSTIAGFSSGYISNCTVSGESNMALRGDSVLTPYLPDEELAAPNTPPFLIVNASRKPQLAPFYLDWLGAGGGMKEPPSKMQWSTIAQESTTLGWLKTPQMPIRVVVYLYPQIDSAGIPAEGSGFEYRCTQPGSQQAPCTYRKVRHLGKPAIEVDLNDRSNANACYVVIHAGWIVRHQQAKHGANVKYDTTDDDDEVAASWAWHRCKNSPN